MNTPVEEKKKKSGCLKKVFLIIFIGFIALIVMGTVLQNKHNKRYESDPDYAREYDAKEDARRKQEEEKRLAEAAREAAKLEAERQTEEARQKKLAELEQRKANNDDLQKDFFRRADIAMQQAEERWRNGTSRAQEFEIPSVKYSPEMSTADREAVSLVQSARSILRRATYDIWYDILTFRPRKDAEKKTHIDEAIGDLQKAVKLDNVSDAIRGEAYWIMGICLLEIGENPEYLGGDKKKAAKSLTEATDCFRRSSELGAVVGTTYLGLSYYKDANKREEGVKLLLQASNTGFLPAKYLLGIFSIKQPYYVMPEAWEALLAAAEADYPPAQESIMHLYNNFDVENKARSLTWAYLSARNGNGRAALLLVGMGAITSPEEEDALLKQAADQGIPDAQYLYGYRTYARGVMEHKRTGSMSLLVSGQASILAAAMEGHQQAIKFFQEQRAAKK